jgi:ubiquitin-conjugating enzyme E2 S
MTDSSTSLSPQAIRSLMKELRQMNVNAHSNSSSSTCTHQIDDIQLFINENNLSSIEAAIDGPIGTPFVDGIFRIRLLLSSDYPIVPPKGYFLTKIFHPNVAVSTGEICVNTLKKDWDPSFMGIIHILQVIRCLLIVPNPESALNEDAGKLLLENYDDYSRRATLMTKIHAKRNIHQQQHHHQNDTNTSSSTTSSSTTSTATDTNKENTTAAASTSQRISPSKLLNGSNQQASTSTTSAAVNKQQIDKAAKVKKNLKRL